MNLDPDLATLDRLRAGNQAAKQEALAELYRRHKDRVFNVAYRVLGDWNEAHDVVQDVFIKLPRSVRSFRGDAKFKSWIYRLAVNRSIDAHRRRARRASSGLDESASGAHEERAMTSPPPPQPEVPVRIQERDARVQAALNSLSPKLRAAAVLRYIEGLSYEELAEALDASMGTIKSRLNRAHTALSRILLEMDPDGPSE